VIYSKCNVYDCLLLKIHLEFFCCCFNPFKGQGEVTQRTWWSWSDSVEFYRHVCMYVERNTDTY